MRKFTHLQTHLCGSNTELDNRPSAGSWVAINFLLWVNSFREMVERIAGGQTRSNSSNWKSVGLELKGRLTSENLSDPRITEISSNRMKSINIEMNYRDVWDWETEFPFGDAERTLTNGSQPRITSLLSTVTFLRCVSINTSAISKSVRDNPKLIQSFKPPSLVALCQN